MNEKLLKSCWPAGRRQDRREAALGPSSGMSGRVLHATLKGQQSKSVNFFNFHLPAISSLESAVPSVEVVEVGCFASSVGYNWQMISLLCDDGVVLNATFLIQKQRERWLVDRESIGTWRRQCLHERVGVSSRHPNDTKIQSELGREKSSGRISGRLRASQ